MPIRLRLLLAYLAVGIVLIGGGGVFFERQLRAGAQTSMDAALRARATDQEQLVPETGEDVNFQDAPARANSSGVMFTQLFAPNGALVEASESIGPQPLLTPADFRAARAGSRRLTTHRGGEPLRLLTVPVTRGAGVWVLVVGGFLRPAQDTISTVRTGLLIGGGTLLLAGAAGVWLLAGAALRPVERMRRRAAEIRARDLDMRLDVPGTSDELATLARTLNELLARQQAALRRQRELVADAGHELRTPLAVLQTELELAAQPGRTLAELATAVTAAAEETQRLARLAGNLLFLAQSDDGEIVVRPRHQPIAPVLCLAAEVATARGSPVRVAVRTEVADDLAAPVDPDRLRQAVDNLLDNALHAAPVGSAITVRGFAEDGHTVVEVLDNGLGFPGSFLPSAFERFRRGDTARGRDTGGAGLGLAIVRAIAEAHGGHATAANRPGGGAAVRIVLPEALP